MNFARVAADLYGAAMVSAAFAVLPFKDEEGKAV